MNRVVHFEMQTEDLNKITEFYSEVFGWIISKKAKGNEDYWLVATGSASERGINGGLKMGSSKTSGMVPTIQVADLDQVVDDIKSHGGKLLESKKSLPGTGYIAYCSDPEGNVIGLLQYDASVK